MSVVLFVCTGNSCRSPMAEGILKQIFAENHIKNILVLSAGTQAPVGMEAPMNAKIVSLENGINLDMHRAKNVTVEMTDKADLVFVMEKSHKLMIQAKNPASKAKLFFLNQMIEPGVEAEIADPIGENLEMYRLCYNEINRLLHQGLPSILNYLKQHRKE